jgi:K+-sensing histidine kinase KdpD
VRYTKRLADRLHAPWTAISIETRRSLQLTDEQRDRLADTLRLAEALGGEALTIPGVGRRIADDVIHFAQANNVTQIIIGKSTRSLVVRTHARLGGARSGAARRQYQRQRHRRRRARGGAGSQEDGADAPNGRSRSIRGPI